MSLKYFSHDPTRFYSTQCCYFSHLYTFSLHNDCINNCMLACYFNLIGHSVFLKMFMKMYKGKNTVNSNSKMIR